MSPAARSPRGAWPLLLAAPLALAALARPLANPDLFWQLSAGRWMLSEGALPRADVFSWTRSGAPWVDFEWLSQLFYAVAHAAAGFAGVWLLKTAILAAALAIVIEILREQGQTSAGQAVGLLAAALSLIPSADARPENFSLLFFVFQIGWLENERRCEQAPRGAGRLIAAAVMYALWADLHAGFVFGLGLIACYAVGSGDLTKLSSMVQLGAAAAAGTLANPYGWGVWLVLLEHARTMPQLRQLIVEWRPVSVLNSWTWPFWALLWLTPAAIWWAGRSGRAVPRAHVLALGGLAAACWQTRNTPYFCLAASIYLPRLAGRIRAQWVPAAAALALLFLLGWVWNGSAQAAQTSRPPWELSGWPERAASFLEQEKPALAGMDVYEPYAWGGYFGWRDWPDYRVFWDGRYLFSDFLIEDDAARESPTTWQAFLDKHHVDIVVLEQTKLMFSRSAEGGIPRPFYIYFMPQPRWALVHWDPEALVFVRRQKAPPAFLEAREFRYMRPGDEAWVRSEIENGSLKREELRHDTERIFAAPDLAPKRDPQ